MSGREYSIAAGRTVKVEDFRVDSDDKNPHAEKGVPVVSWGAGKNNHFPFCACRV